MTQGPYFKMTVYVCARCGARGDDERVADVHYALVHHRADERKRASVGFARGDAHNDDGVCPTLHHSAWLPEANDEDRRVRCPDCGGRFAWANIGRPPL